MSAMHDDGEGYDWRARLHHHDDDDILGYCILVKGTRLGAMGIFGESKMLRCLRYGGIWWVRVSSCPGSIARAQPEWGCRDMIT